MMAMSIVAVVIAAIVFIGSVIVVRTNTANPNVPARSIPPTLSPTPMPSPVPTDRPFPSDTLTPSPPAGGSDSFPSTSSTITPTPTQSAAASLTIPVYPGARLVSQTPNQQTYQTEVEAASVGKWYKQIFDSRNLNIRNYISTTTNGRTQIVISVSQQNHDGTVTINQSPNTQTIIEISS